MGIRIEKVHKRFRDFSALNGVDLNVETGELVALLGPSGCGKTTLLRIIAGLEFADSGEIYLDIEGAQSSIGNRRVGFVFQHYALFRHMTVFENIAFGLTVKKRQGGLDDAAIRGKVMELLHLIHLDEMQNRYPAELSGGQRQRVALARTLAVDPKVLLLDEPFGALDAKVRKELRRWLRDLHDKMPITTVFVTHDHEEAMDLADRVVVMNEGRVEQAGLPEEIYNNPANEFVYDFLGSYNSFDGWRDGAGACHVAHAGETLPPDAVPMRLYARPHDTGIARDAQDSRALPARILHINQAGPLVSVDAESDQGIFYSVSITRQQFAVLNLQKGERIFLRPRNIQAFRA